MAEHRRTDEGEVFRSPSLIGPTLYEQVVGDDTIPHTWRREAACLGSGINFIDPRLKNDIRKAKDICFRQCRVRSDCFEFAMEVRENFGIWGGLTARERELLRRQRRQQSF